jgi:hypothetical protein
MTEHVEWVEDPEKSDSGPGWTKTVHVPTAPIEMRSGDILSMSTPLLDDGDGGLVIAPWAESTIERSEQT